MDEIQTDYLVVGAGATAMAFVDTLLSLTKAQVVLVDRRHKAGGHWLDAYPFVRLHQPSAVYGVASRRLGEDRIDEVGPNVGFYERATSNEICDYYARVLDQFLATGRVRFLAMHDYQGEDAEGHHVVSLLTGAGTNIRARRLVDATYIASEIPSRHSLPYAIEPGVHVATPNDLVDVDEAPGGFAVIGAGKTAMDTCNWLLDAGVDPDRIQWIRPRDPWLFDRRSFQPLELVASYMEMQAHWVEAAVEAQDGADFARRLESSGVFLRIDPKVEPDVYRGPIISARELEALRTIERVVRKGKVRNIAVNHISLDDGDVSIPPGCLCVDCTAAGVRSAQERPIFAQDRITLQYVTIAGAPWGAATIGAVEALGADDEEKNRLCPPVRFSGNASDLLRMAQAGMKGLVARSAEPEVAAWDSSCRLNPAQAARDHLSDPRVSSAFGSTVSNIGPALRNLARRVAEPTATPT